MEKRRKAIIASIKEDKNKINRSECGTFDGKKASKVFTFIV